MHVRKQVRNAVTAKVKEVNDLKKSTYESRVYQLQKEDLPAALIFSETEVVNPATHGQRRIQERLIETVVYLFARADKEIENVLDDLSEKVENKILEDETFGGIAAATVLSNTQLLIGGDPDAPTGAARLSFITTILTQSGISSVPTQKSGGMFDG